MQRQRQRVINNSDGKRYLPKLLVTSASGEFANTSAAIANKSRIEPPTVWVRKKR